MSGPTIKSLEQLTIEERYELEELLDRSALEEMVHSFEDLFGVPLRIYSQTGRLLADTSREPGLYSLLETHLTGRLALQKVVDQVRRARPDPGKPELIPCLSGGHYLASAIAQDGRLLGRTIFGPFLPPEVTEMPQELLDAAGDTERSQLEEQWVDLTRLSHDDAARIDDHLRATLSVLVFSGLKAHLASHLHLASVKESFRELGEKTEKLQAAYDRLKELDRLKSNFLATVSHELRTPLTSIIGYSEMLLEGIAGDINTEQLEFVETIHDKGEQLLGLIKTLLDLSKLESGTMSLKKDMISCAAVVRDVVATLTPTAMKKGVALSAVAEADLPDLFADAGRLRQVLLNLTENAIKFTPEGGQVLVGARVAFMSDNLGDGPGLAVMAAARRPAIQLYVADTGIGISAEDRERVFDAFYQVDSSSTREAGGTGLGLSIVKRLVDAHDGVVDISKNEPHGTIFLVTLPSKRVHPEPRAGQVS